MAVAWDLKSQRGQVLGVVDRARNVWACVCLLRDRYYFYDISRANSVAMINAIVICMYLFDFNNKII